MSHEHTTGGLQAHEVRFESDGLRLDGLVHHRGDQRPPFPVAVICSGFQGLKEIIPTKLWAPLTAAGMACFSFDYRGLGTSKGERGRIIPAEQVRDVRSALTFLEGSPIIDPTRIALVGWGLGGGIVVQAADEDRASEQ